MEREINRIRNARLQCYQFEHSEVQATLAISDTSARLKRLEEDILGEVQPGALILRIDALEETCFGELHSEKSFGKRLENIEAEIYGTIKIKAHTISKCTEMKQSEQNGIQSHSNITPFFLQKQNQ